MIKGNESGSDSEDDWVTRNEDGEDLDLSVMTVNSDRFNNNGGTKEGQTMPVGEQARILAEAVKCVLGNVQQQPQQGLDALGPVLSRITDVLEMTQKRDTELEREREKRKRKEAEGPVILEDPVVIIERELKIKDDSNAVIDIEARSLLGRNPNAPPSEWWGGDKKWPRVARPAVGALLDIRHMCPSHVAEEAVLGYHDAQKFLELKHFVNKNSGSLGKVQKQWEFMKDATNDQLVGKHERNWSEIESVQEAVEGVSIWICGKTN